MPSLISQLDTIKTPRVLVFGDLILDRYTFGNAERVSPEAPVLVLRADTQEVRLGGAASVAFLLRALDADVTLAGVVGDDAAGRMVQKLVRDAGIDSHPVYVEPSRPTTVKERFVGRAADRHPHQMLRVDSEMREPINPELEAQLITDLMERLDDHDALLISDYAKGVCTHRLLITIIAGARMADVPSIIDPARTADFGRYHRATLVKPNRFEAELASGRKIRTPQEALVAGQRFCQKHEFGATLITLDQDGMALVQDDESEELFPSEPREVYDITGAGDMALAALGVCLASKLLLQDAIRVANVAAGLEVERLGVAPVTREELRAVLNGTGTLRAPSVLPSLPNSKFRDPKLNLVSADEAAALAVSYRRQGKTVVFTNGCFDLLHIGHVTCLNEAAALGDVLIVAVNSDASVRQLKGPDRPVIPESDRAALLASLAAVDHVEIFDEPSPCALIKKICPQILVKGGTATEIVGHEIVESYGGRAVQVSATPGWSTTEIVGRIHSAHSPTVPTTELLRAGLVIGQADDPHSIHPVHESPH